MTDEPTADSGLPPATADAATPPAQPAPDATMDPTPTESMSTVPPPAPAPPAATMPVAPPAAPAPVAAQPAVAWQAPPPAAAVKGERTALAMVAGILLILGGIGGILLGLFIAIVGGTFVSSFDFSQFANMPNLNGGDPSALFGGAVAFVGAVIVAYSIAYLLAGIGVLRSSNWARVLGIVVGVLSGLVWLSAVTNTDRVANGGGVLFPLVALLVHAYIVAALLFFWRNRPSTT